MRAVLDPNVLISAMLSRTGAPAQLIREWQAGGFELIVSPALLDELRQVLQYPKIANRVDANHARDYLTLLATQGSLHPDPTTEPSVISSDPDDNYLIALAESTRSLLVSGDSDLLDLRDRIPVLPPREFIEQLLKDL